MRVRRFLGFVAVLATGCLTPLQGGMRPSPTPLDFRSGPTTARLVFVRPQAFFGSGVSAVLLDGTSGRVLGNAVNNSVFVADLEPGEHHLCALPVFEQASRQIPLSTLEDLGVVSPITRVWLAAGQTYVVQVGVDPGPRLVATPVRPGSPRAQALFELLPTLRQAVATADAPEFLTIVDPASRAAWYDYCLNSSDDARFRLSPEDAFDPDSLSELSADPPAP